MPRRCRGIRGDAPQGYLFRFAPLRGHRPLRTSNEGAVVQRLSLRRFALPPSQREALEFRACGRGERIATPVCGLARNDTARSLCKQFFRQREALTPPSQREARPRLRARGY